MAYRLLAVLIGLGAVVLLEGLLVLCDVASPGRVVDPLAGFSRVEPLFELDRDAGVFRTARSRSLYFGDQVFPDDKSPKQFRIFCLGGSTVRGRPYRTETSFLKWLELELAESLPEREVVTVNCGGLSYASFRLKPILAEVFDHAPDLVILATGHNEFLEDRSFSNIKRRSAAAAWIEDRFFRLRTVTLARTLTGRGRVQSAGIAADSEIRSSKVEARLDRQSGYASYQRDDAWRQNVVDEYERSVELMVLACQQRKVPVILVHLGSNLRDCPPVKSQHRDQLSVDDEAAWRDDYDSATRFDSAGKPGEALDRYRLAEKRDGQFALGAWRIARCLDRLGQHGEAAGAYRRARQLDICPLRMIEELDERLEAIGDRTGTPRADVRRRIERLSPERLPGFDWYIDHVHPTIACHQQIARLLVDELVRLKLVPPGRPSPPSRRREVFRDHLERLGPIYLANGARRVSWLEHWARQPELLGEVRPTVPAEFLRAGHRQLDFDDRLAAWEFYRQALDADPAAGVALLEHARGLFLGGRTGSARFLVDRLSTHGTARTRPVDLTLAALVLAVDLDDRPAVSELWLEYAAGWESDPPPADSPWLVGLPDALERAGKLARTEE